MTVSDTGIGMSTEAIERLFQPFVQADASTTRRFGGTGLGLAIARRLCHQMGGGIRVESRLGRGSRFVVLIPVTVVSKPVEPAACPDTPEEIGEAHVLIAEDNATNQLVLSLFLRKLGLSFEIAVNGAEAVAAWERGGFDLVLMDIEMPVLDGYEAAREIRRRELATARCAPRSSRCRQTRCSRTASARAMWEWTSSPRSRSTSRCCTA